MRQILRLLVIPLLFGFAAPALAQGPLVISGRVTDQAGAPIPGAQIVIEGTTIGTVAGDNGEYRLVVGAPRAGMVLLVRSISYKADSFPVVGKPHSGLPPRNRRSSPE
jgi:hypothetical protein